MNGREEGAQSRRVGRPFSSSEEELKWLLKHATNLYEMFRMLYDIAQDDAERYRLAWLSARRRAAQEAVYATEALVMRDTEITRLRAELEEARQSTGVARN